jgi:DivIVA domain-containing protein
MKLWKKDTEEPGNADAALRGTGARVTPLDVQEKKFRRSSRPSGGYVMREVDEFLDDITDTLSTLIAENERLSRSAAGADRSSASAPTQGEGDRAAVDAFLRREKGFLQDLGGLVQAHAEELKAMVRSARAASAPAATEDAAAAEPLEPAGPAPAAIVAGEEPSTPPVVPGAEPGGTAHSPEPEETGGGDATATDTGVVAEEPIRLEEPEPARSGRADEQDRSLRELFWGED